MEKVNDIDQYTNAILRTAIEQNITSGDYVFCKKLLGLLNEKKYDEAKDALKINTFEFAKSLASIDSLGPSTKNLYSLGFIYAFIKEALYRENYSEVEENLKKLIQIFENKRNIAEESTIKR